MGQLDKDFVDVETVLNEVAEAADEDLEKYIKALEDEHLAEDDAWLEDYIKHGH